MSCNDVASILDTHRTARLAPAEHAQLDAHLSACTDCATAWHAQTELLALRVPPAPATLLERALLASHLPQSAPARRARMPLVIGSAVLAGAALAAGVTVVSRTQLPLANTASAPARAPAIAPVPAAAAPITDVSATAAAQSSDRTTTPDHVNTSLTLVPFLRVNPVYPAEALAEKLEGRVVIDLDVTATGEVDDAHVVESTDARFEASALAAVQQWKYLPRIVAGKRAATENLRTVINYQMARTPTPAAMQQATAPVGPGLPPDSAAFESTMLTAWQRVIADDLRGAELALDEFRATYALTPFITGEVWNAYAYVYTLEGNYDRAIDAYESAIAVFARSGSTQGRWVELANLYFARNQYDMALNTLLRPRRASNDSSRRSSPEAEALMEKLRALGITEESL